MNWFWLRRHRRIPSAVGVPHGNAGRLAGRKAIRRIVCAGLGVVVAGAAAGCTGSPGSTGQGRAAVQAQDRQWSAHAALNVPFLTTRELFLMKYADPLLADQYLHLPPGQRAAFLATAVDPLPLIPAQLQGGTGSPTDIDTIEWFASPDDICRAFAGLRQLAAQPTLAPLGPILSANNLGIGLDPAQWPTIWYKGGSEPGVLTLGYLATNSKGQTFVVVAMLSNPASALSPSAVLGLLAIVQGAFELLR